MSTPNQQIGWSQEAKLLQQISKQLDRLIKVTANCVCPTTTSTTTTTSTSTTTTSSSSSTTTTTTASSNFICVSGAGSSEVNGTYEFYQFITVNGITRPTYAPVGSPDPSTDIQVTIISTGPSAIWAIRWPDQEYNYYFGNTSPAPQYPYLETSWNIASEGIGPTPVITQGPC